MVIKVYYVVIKVYYAVIKVYYAVIKVYYTVIKAYYAVIKVYYAVIKVYYVVPDLVEGENHTSQCLSVQWYIPLPCSHHSSQLHPPYRTCKRHHREQVNLLHTQY